MPGLVQAVPALVHRPVQAGREEVLVPARRDPHVAAPRPVANGCTVSSIRQPRRRSPSARRSRATSSPLPIDGKRRVQRTRRRPASACRDERRDHRHQLGLQLREQRRDLGGRHLGLVVVEQRRRRDTRTRRCRRGIRRSGARARSCAPGMARSGEVRRSRAATHASWPIDAARASSAASSVGTRRAFSQRRRTTRTSARVVGVRTGAVELGGGGLEQPAGLVVDEHLVADPLERRQRLGARLAAARRHHRLLVPLQPAARVAQVGQLASRCFRPSRRSLIYVS